MTRRRYLTAAALLAIIALPSCAGKPTTKDETQVKPACVGIADDKAWAACMERFKDVRPKHEPATLIFEDWRTTP